MGQSIPVGQLTTERLELIAMDGSPGAVGDPPLCLALPADPAGVLAQVRAWTRHLLADATPTARVDAVLVADELVTHAYTGEYAPTVLRLRRRFDAEVLRVELDTERMPSHGCGPAAVDAGEGGDRCGLAMTERLCGHWGTTARPGGATLWADVPLTATTSRSEAAVREYGRRFLGRDDEAPAS
jgi:hypothetical protein